MVNKAPSRNESYYRLSEPISELESLGLSDPSLATLAAQLRQALEGCLELSRPARDEAEIARYYWPKESQSSEEPAEWFMAAIRDAFNSGRAAAAPAVEGARQAPPRTNLCVAHGVDWCEVCLTDEAYRESRSPDGDGQEESGIGNAERVGPKGVSIGNAGSAHELTTRDGNRAERTRPLGTNDDRSRGPDANDVAWSEPADSHHPSTGVAEGREDAMSDGDESLHTGDDERIDLVTGILAAAEEIEGSEETTDAAASIIDSCHQIDALLLATIKRERQLAALHGRPAEPGAQKETTKEEER